MLYQSSSAEPPPYSGWAWKEGHTFKTWKRRYCIVKAGRLSYYEKEPSSIDDTVAPIAVVDLSGGRIAVPKSTRSSISRGPAWRLETSTAAQNEGTHHKYIMAGEYVDKSREWQGVLQAHIEFATRRPQLERGSTANATSTCGNPFDDDQPPPPPPPPPMPNPFDPRLDPLPAVEHRLSANPFDDEWPPANGVPRQGSYGELSTPATAPIHALPPQEPAYTPPAAHRAPPPVANAPAAPRTGSRVTSALAAVGNSTAKGARAVAAAACSAAAHAPSLHTASGTLAAHDSARHLTKLRQRMDQVVVTEHHVP